MSDLVAQASHPHTHAPGSPVADLSPWYSLKVTEAPLSPERYGAVGDWNGSTGTDDTTAVQDAINAAQGAGNGTVRLTRRYYCPSGLSITDQVTIDGDGVGSVEADGAFAGSHLVDVNPATYTDRINLKGLKIVLPIGNAGNALRVKYAQKSQLDGLFLVGGAKSLLMDDYANDNWITNLTVQAGNGHGVYQKADTASGENHYNGVEVTTATSATPTSGFSIVSTLGGDGGGFYLNDVKCVMGGHATKGFNFDASSVGGLASWPIFAEQCVADSCSTPFWATSWSNFFLMGGWAYSTGTDVIMLDGCGDVRMIGLPLKGGTNGIAFRNNAGGRTISALHYFPDATNAYYIDSPGHQPSSGLCIFGDMYTHNLTNDWTSLTSALSALQVNMGAPSIAVSNTASGGALKLHDDSGHNKFLRIASSGDLVLLNSAFSQQILGISDAGSMTVKGGFAVNGSSAVGKQTVTGSRGGNAALASLLTALAAYGLVLDSTSA